MSYLLVPWCYLWFKQKEMDHLIWCVENRTFILSLLFFCWYTSASQDSKFLDFFTIIIIVGISSRLYFKNISLKKEESKIKNKSSLFKIVMLNKFILLEKLGERYYNLNKQLPLSFCQTILLTSIKNNRRL